MKRFLPAWSGAVGVLVASLLLSAPVAARQLHTVSGVVLDSVNRPAEAGVVLARRAEDARRPVQLIPASVDAHGRFSFELESGSWLLRADGEPQGDDPATFSLRVERAIAGLQLPRGAPEPLIAGRITTATERPLARTRLSLLGPRHPAVRAAIAPTDDQGRFVVLLRAPDAPRFLRLGVDRRGSAYTWVGIDRARPSSWTEIVLPDGLPLRGKVLDPQGRPVTGAHVRICPPRPSSGVQACRTLTTGTDGSFALEHAPPSLYWLSAEAPGFASSSPQSPMVAYPGAPPASKTLMLAEETTLRGAIVGLPFEDSLAVPVVATRAGSASRTTVTDGSGRYVLRDLALGRWLIKAQHGPRVAYAWANVAPGENQAAPLFFDRDLRLTMQVVDTDGQGGVGPEPKLWSRRGASRPGACPQRVCLRSAPRSRVSISQLIDGRLVAEPLKPGRQTFDIELGGRYQRFAFDVLEGGPMQLEVHTVPVTIGVRTRSGTPVPGAMISVFPQATPSSGTTGPGAGSLGLPVALATLTTDVHGERALQLAPGSYRVLVEHDGYAPSTSAVEVPATGPLDIALQSGREVKLSVETPFGPPTTLSVYLGGLVPRPLPVVRRGAFDFGVEHVPDGHATLWLASAGEGAKAIAIADEGARTVVLDAVGWLWVDPGAMPYGTTVTVSRPAESIWQAPMLEPPAEAHDLARFELPAGDWTLQAWRPDGTTATLQTTLEPYTVRTVRLAGAASE